jgi:hypothetical protein
MGVDSLGPVFSSKGSVLVKKGPPPTPVKKEKGSDEPSMEQEEFSNKKKKETLASFYGRDGKALTDEEYLQNLTR